MIESVRFLLHHALYALAAAVLFVIGAGCATTVYRRRMEWLLGFPRWAAQRLRWIHEKKPSVPALGLYIFAFNGTAMLVYMLLGLIPGVGAVITFLTGLNVILIGLISRETPIVETAPRERTPPTSVRVCGILTLLLELPCFFFTMGMTLWMKSGIFGISQSADWSPIVQRLTAYYTIILPVLFTSAMVEAYAVSFSYREAPPAG